MDVVTHTTALWRSRLNHSLWNFHYVFPYTGFRGGEGGCDDSSGTIIRCHPFHNPYLILCLLFSVTIEPSSWLLPGLRLLAGGISLSMATRQRRCRVEKVKGGKVDIHTGYLSCTESEKMSHTDAEIHFPVLHFRETSFLETLPDHLQSSFALIISRGLTSVQETEDALIHTQKQQLQMKRLGFCFFSPGLLPPTTEEKLQVFRDVFSLFALVWLCPCCLRHFSCVHLNSS